MRFYAKCVLSAALIMQGMPSLIMSSQAAQLAKGSLPAKGQESGFTGHVDAYYELHYAKFVSRENIVFTIDHDAIQRIVYKNNDNYTGLVAYPLEKKIMFFRQSGPLKYYTVLSIAEFERETASYIAQKNVEEYERTGFSDHFLALLDATPTDAPTEPPAIHDEKQCVRLAWKQETFSSDAVFVSEHCNQIDVPHAWLRYTDLNIPDQVTGFPFYFSKRAMDSASTKANAVDTPLNHESTAEKFKVFAGKALRTAGRAVDELQEFTYRVEKLSPGPVKKVDFINLMDFIRVDSLKKLQKSFPDHPDFVDPNGNSTGSSHRHHHDFFD